MESYYSKWLTFAFTVSKGKCKHPSPRVPCPIWLWHHNHLWWHIQEPRSREQKLLCIRGEEKLGKCCLSCMSESLLSDKHLCQEGPYGDWSREKSLREKSQSLYLLMGIHESNKTKKAWEWIALPRQGSWLHPSHHHAFCGLFLLQGSLAHLQFHCLLSIIYWAPLGSDSMLRTGDANMKRLGGPCPQWDPSIVGETDMLIKSYKTILLKHISVCGIMCIFMCLFIHSVLHNSAVDFITFTARFVAPQHLDCREC